jgi:hypothetical protein
MMMNITSVELEEKNRQVQRTQRRYYNLQTKGIIYRLLNRKKIQASYDVYHRRLTEYQQMIEIVKKNWDKR